MKCRYWKRAACSVDQTDYNYEKYKYARHDCPKGVDKNCNVVKRDKVIKAHCSGRALDCLENGIPCFIGPKLYKGDVAVTIHIKAADYAKIRGSK